MKPSEAIVSDSQSDSDVVSTYDVGEGEMHLIQSCGRSVRERVPGASIYNVHKMLLFYDPLPPSLFVRRLYLLVNLSTFETHNLFVVTEPRTCFVSDNWEVE